MVAFLESRMSSEMGSLIERHGGVPYSAPAMQELYLKDSPDVQELIVDICRGRLDVMVLLTGVGTRAMLEVADEMGFKDELIGNYELYAFESIKKQNIFSRIISSFNYLIWGDV